MRSMRGPRVERRAAVPDPYRVRHVESVRRTVSQVRKAVAARTGDVYDRTPTQARPTLGPHETPHAVRAPRPHAPRHEPRPRDGRCRHGGREPHGGRDRRRREPVVRVRTDDRARGRHESRHAARPRPGLRGDGGARAADLGRRRGRRRRCVEPVPPLVGRRTGPHPRRAHAHGVDHAHAPLRDPDDGDARPRRGEPADGVLHVPQPRHLRPRAARADAARRRRLPGDRDGAAQRNRVPPGGGNRRRPAARDLEARRRGHRRDGVERARRGCKPRDDSAGSRGTRGVGGARIHAGRSRRRSARADVRPRRRDRRALHAREPARQGGPARLLGHVVRAVRREHAGPAGALP